MLYDQIGDNYARRRKPDLRIAQRINTALGDAASVVNVGAGAGSYEPADRMVIAIEPSEIMIRQRALQSAAVVMAQAERIPLRTKSVDAAMAILTIHHWTDWKQGLRELKRIARKRIVLLTWDPAHRGFWLTEQYFPEILDADKTIFPSLEEIQQELGSAEISDITVPHDCHDGFLGAYWRRPQCYLDANARAAISAFAKLPGLQDGLQRLRKDLEDGTWLSQHSELMSRQDYDVGYRVITFTYQ